MSQSHLMKLRNQKTSRRGLEYDLLAAQNIDPDSSANATIEEGSASSTIEIRVDVN